MLHQPATQGRGTVRNLILEAEEVARVPLLLEQILARHTGRTPEHVREDTDRAMVLLGAAAVDYGVVDVVLEEQSTGRRVTPPGT